MTVSELIEKLKAYPGDMLVTLHSQDGYRHSFDIQDIDTRMVVKEEVKSGGFMPWYRRPKQGETNDFNVLVIF
jgi:hypothetical protein